MYSAVVAPPSWLRVEGAHPAAVLALMVCGVEPAMKEPQGILAVLSRSPIVLAFGKLPWAVVGLEHKSPVGSISPIMVMPPLPSSIRLPVVMEFVFVTLL